MLAGIEAGGTKFRMVVGSGPGNIVADETVPTTTPAETIPAALAAVRRAGVEVAAAGLGAFGPLDLDPDSPTYGRLVATPKPGWTGADILAAVRDGLGVPVALDTDVGAAALGEGRWGAATDVASFIYLTVGTGLGGALVVERRVHHGLGHPEMGHLVVRPEPGDGFAGACPFHGACWEGMAAGPAIAGRWGAPGPELADRREVWELEAAYLAQGLRTLTYVAAPQRIVLGGGVMRVPGLLEQVRQNLSAELAGYASHPLPNADVDRYVVGAGLGQDAGVLGALVLAEGASATAAR